MSLSHFLLPSALAALACAGACAALLGCGSSSPKQSPSSSNASAKSGKSVASTSAKASPAAKEALAQEAAAALAQIKSPGQVLVRIGRHEITKGELYRWMSIGFSEKREVPEPPEFNRCIINLRKVEQTDVGGEGRAANDLKEVCAKRFEEELQGGLGSLINNTWLIEEAAEDGITIDQRELEHTFKLSLAQFSKQPGGLAAMTKLTGRTAADLKYELKASQASDKIYQMSAAKIPKLTPARLARYYQQHKHDFLIPERRDLYILHTKSRAAALHAKAEIQAGKSFASVAKALKVTQPFGSKEGRERKLSRKSYAQHELIDAIFGARPGVLSGPLELSPKSNKYVAAGFYVFEVLHKIPARQQSFAEVKSQLKEQLTQALKSTTLKDFVKAYKAKWKARTDCSPGYVIENCRQYKGKESETADPYVL